MTSTGSSEPGAQDTGQPEACEHEWIHVIEYDTDCDKTRHSLQCRLCDANAGNNVRTKIHGWRATYAQFPAERFEMTYKRPSNFIGTGMNQWYPIAD